MQNNLSINDSSSSLPEDGQKTITLSKQELNDMIEQAVNATMTKFQNEMSRKPTKSSQWLNTADAAAILGKNPNTLRRMVKDGRLRLKHEVRDDRLKNAIYPVYMFNVVACQQRLMTPPEERGK